MTLLIFALSAASAALVIGGVLMSARLVFRATYLEYALYRETMGKVRALVRAVAFQFPAKMSVFSHGRAGLTDALEKLGWPYGDVTSDQYRAATGVFSIASGILSAILFFVIAGMTFLSLAVGLTIFLLVGLTMWSVFDVLLRHSSRQRSNQISRQLPYFLDLVLMIVQSGETPLHAIELYTRAQSTSALAEELRVLSEDMRLMRLTDALERIRVRVGDPAVKNVLGALAQSQRFGTELDDAIKSQANALRNIRSEHALRAAERLNASFEIPSIIMLAAAMLVILTPEIVAMLSVDLF